MQEMKLVDISATSRRTIGKLKIDEIGTIIDTCIRATMGLIIMLGRVKYI
jgi:hypothetical protein